MLKKENKNVSFVKKNDFSRITLTLKCLNNSKFIFLWTPGKNKTYIIKKILLDNENIARFQIKQMELTFPYNLLILFFVSKVLAFTTVLLDAISLIPPEF